MGESALVLTHKEGAASGVSPCLDENRQNNPPQAGEGEGEGRGRERGEVEGEGEGEGRGRGVEPGGVILPVLVFIQRLRQKRHPPCV